MKKVTVAMKLNGDRTLFIKGRIKDTRTVFGRKEYLITKAKTDDFYVSEKSIVYKDE